MFKRIAIIGLPGSGKSTFALKLSKILNIPVHHLDKYTFEGKTKRNKQEYLLIKESLVKEDFWIIEGCSHSTLEMRFARANIVIYFKISRIVCIWRICKRLFKFNKSVEDTGCLNGINWTLIKYIWNFDANWKHDIEKFRRRYPQVEFLVFLNSKEADKFLGKFKEKEFDLSMP